jgi:flagellar biogenesis protein FliO
MKKTLFFLFSTLALHAEEVVAAQEAPSYEGTLLKMLTTLGGLLLLVFLTIWILKKLSNGRFGGMGPSKKIIILEKKPLSPKTLLYLVELEGKKILISESQFEVRMLPQTAEETYE